MALPAPLIRLNAQKDDLNEIVTKRDLRFGEQKIKYAQIQENQRDGIITTDEKAFLEKWPDEIEARSAQLHEEAELYMFMYAEYCYIYNVPCKWSSAKTEDESRKMFDEFVKSRGYTLADVLLMIGLGNNALDNMGVDALIDYMKSPMREGKNVFLVDGDACSGPGFDENDIACNVADAARRMCHFLGGCTYMRFAASAFNTRMSFEEFRRKHGYGDHVELCPAALNKDGEVMYGGKDTHIFNCKYEEGGQGTVVVCGAGVIGEQEIKRAFEIGCYTIVAVSVKQLRGDKVVERNVYDSLRISDPKMGQVAVVNSRVMSDRRDVRLY